MQAQKEKIAKDKQKRDERRAKRAEKKNQELNRNQQVTAKEIKMRRNRCVSSFTSFL